MALFLSPSAIRLAVLFALISLHMTWLRFLNQQVPDPYLDEVFHVPQAQAYWAGRWSQWDDKITTPPSLYLWSYAFNAVRRLPAADPAEMLSVKELRFSNAVLVYVLMITLYVWVAVSRRPVNEDRALQKEIVLLAFPLLAFFSGLYYTDLFSAWSVVATFVVWEVGRSSTGVRKVVFQILHVIFGLLSLASRQTNIFWVAVCLGGLSVVDAVQAGTTVNVLRDPEIGGARFEDIVHLILQLLPPAITRLPAVVLALWPQLILLASFVAFVVWNGGVVLGDKSNHIATIHLPQLLYIWPCFVFFSWPVLLPQLQSFRRLRQQLPRPWLSILLMLAMATAVHYNTIVHPFTLADNRHYVFYVFRILMRTWWIKYAAVPVYFVCACLVVGALRGGRRGPDGENDIVKLSFVLVWFASTALSLITAPLVEPRYFIVPWLIWRMYIPEVGVFDVMQKESVPRKNDAKGKAVRDMNLIQWTLQMMVGYSLWIELVWYLAVNYTTCWMFLNRGFGWKQEPGKVQRFMW